jgi:hypothetical protein
MGWSKLLLMAKKIFRRVLVYLWLIIAVNLLCYVTFGIPIACSAKLETDTNFLDTYLAPLIWFEIHGISFSPFFSLSALIHMIWIEIDLIDSDILGKEILDGPKGILKWFSNIVLFPLFSAIFYYLILVFLVFFIFCLSIIYLVLISIPYEAGIDWVVVNSSFYFEYPLHWFIGGVTELLISSFNSILFLVTFYFSFTRYPNYVKSVGKNSDVRLKARLLRFIKERRQLLSKIYLIYLIYLSPVIIAWLYPVIRIKWLGIQTINSTPEKIPVGFSVLAFLFILGLIITLVLIVRNNRKTWRINLKEELKEELKNESNQII